jgi:NAD(P)-dependent dehydrogenase (short-subunit alcohol dehydrogenase family)
MSKQMTVLVTGASSGIGRATAIELAGRGHTVLAAARREKELAELALQHDSITAVTIDVTDAGSVRAAAARVEELTNGYGVDVLVNSAGYALDGPVEALSGEAVEHQFATNVFGLLSITRAFLPAMRARGSGRVINVSSVVGRVAFPGVGVYSATKHALEALSDALRMELAPFGVSVVLIEPGFVHTDIGDASQRQSADFDVTGDGYEQLIAKTREFLAKQVAENGIAPEKVAALIADAAEAAKPRPRYVLPASSRVMVSVMTRLPDRLADRAKGLAAR